MTLAGLTPFVSLHWSASGSGRRRIGGGAVALGAAGAALGAVAREVRAVSLLAFMAVLPVAFLALVPAGPSVVPALLYLAALTRA